MSICATNSVVFDARQVSLSRRKLVDNERWAMLNKKTFQEILNALLAQSTSSSSSSQPSSALTFALGQRSNKSTTSLNGKTTTKDREYDFSGRRRVPKNECTSNLESDETSRRTDFCVDNDDDDDDDYDDVGIKGRCARKATDRLHSLPAVTAPVTAPFIIGLGGRGQREFILGQSNQARVGETLQGVGIFIVCAMPPSADTNQYHHFTDRPLEGATVPPNAFTRKEECKPHRRSLDTATALSRTGNEALRCVESERVSRNALPRFRLDEKYENDENKKRNDEGGPDETIEIAQNQSHRVMSRSALPGRSSRSPLLNPLHPSHRCFDLDKASQIHSNSPCFSTGKPGPVWSSLLNPDQINKVPAASESFISDFVQISTTLSAETSRASDDSSSTGRRITSEDSKAEIKSTKAIANANPKHASAQFIPRRRTDNAERTKSKNSVTTQSTQKRNTGPEVLLSPALVSTCCGGVGTQVPPPKDKTNVTLPNRTMAPQGAAGLRHSEQSLSLSWSRWMAVDKDVLFCIIEHVLNAEAVALNSGFCFKTPTPTRKAFPTERPATADVERLTNWTALFRSSALGGIFDEREGGRSFRPFPVKPHPRDRQEAVLENGKTEDVMDRGFAGVESKTDSVFSSLDERCTKTREGDLASVEISRCFAHFRLGRAEKQRHRATERRHVAANRKRKCLQSVAGSGFVDVAPEVSSADGIGSTDDDSDRQESEEISRERDVSSFKWKSKMMMRLGAMDNHRMVGLTDSEGVV